MQINYEPPRRSKKKSSTFQLFDSFKINRENVAFAALSVAILGYVGYTAPYIILPLLFSLAVAGSLYFISACLPLVSKKLNFRLSIWHVLVIAGGLTLALNPFEPSHALFLTGLEEGIVDLVGNTDGSVEDNQIELLFTLLRIILVIVALGGGIAAWQQMQQGQSMAPIFQFIGGIFGVVLAIDIITAVIL